MDPARGGLRGWSLARQLFALQVVVVVAVVLTGGALAAGYARRHTEDDARDKAVSVATTLAAQPAVRDALGAPAPSSALQPLADRVRTAAGVRFVTIMSPDGVRYSHPDPSRIGERFVGHLGPAPAGQVFTETHTGTLGPSVRAVVPVLDAGGRVLGLVATGIAVRVITAELHDQILVLLVVAAGALLLGAVATHRVSARMRRHTHGLRPDELSRMYEYHDAILHSVREGLLLIGPDGRVHLCNEGAATLLSVSRTDVEGRWAGALPDPLGGALESGRPARDDVCLTDERVLVVNTSRIRSGGRDLGTVVTLRDRTELQALTGELDSARGFSEALRARAHESANRLHTVVSLVELGRGEEAVAFATSELDLAQRLTDEIVGAVSEPVLAAALLGKSAEADERGAEVVLSEDSEVDADAVARVDSRDLVTILGNLVDNAVESALERGAGGSPRVVVTVRSDSEDLLIRVADNGPGVDPDEAHLLFRRGWSTKGGQGAAGDRGLGLALVGRAVRRHGGRVDVESDGGAAFTARIPVSREVTS